MAEPLTSWNDLALRWANRAIWIALAIALGWFAQQSYYDYLKAGLLKAGKDKKQIEEIFK